MRTLWLRTAGLVVTAAAVLALGGPHALAGPASGPVATAAATALATAPNHGPAIYDPAWYEGPLDRYDQAWAGQQVWALAVVVSDRGPDDPKLYDSSATDRAEYRYVESVDCDLGAREGLGLRPDKAYWYTVLYFRTQEEAFYYKDGNGLRVVGIAPVTAQQCDGC